MGWMKMMTLSKEDPKDQLVIVSVGLVSADSFYLKNLASSI